MYKTGHAFTYLLLKENVANDVINVSLFAGPVCCEPRHRQVDVVVCRPVSTLKADILNITYDCYSQNMVHCVYMVYRTRNYVTLMLCLPTVILLCDYK